MAVSEAPRIHLSIFVRSSPPSCLLSSYLYKHCIRGGLLDNELVHVSSCGVSYPSLMLLVAQITLIEVVVLDISFACHAAQNA